MWGNWRVHLVAISSWLMHCFRKYIRKSLMAVSKQVLSFWTQILITIDNTEYKATINKRLYCRDKFSLLFCEIRRKLTCFVCATWTLFSTDEVQNVLKKTANFVWQASHLNVLPSSSSACRPVVKNHTNVFYDTRQFLKIMDLYWNLNKNNIFESFH